jgi:SAM-dependent methyltransferase
MKQEHAITDPSAWVLRFAERVPAGGTVLDLACGAGRHTRLFLDRGYRVLAVDRDLAGIGDLGDHAGLEQLQVDLEDGRAPPFAERRFDGVVVVNYLHRPLLPTLVSWVAPGGILIYQTFAQGNERLGRPRNPDFLLGPGELLEAVRGRLRVIAYEDVIVAQPRPAAMQRIAALNDLT